MILVLSAVVEIGFHLISPERDHQAPNGLHLKAGTFGNANPASVVDLAVLAHACQGSSEVVC